MHMILGDIADISTSIGALVSAASLFFGFILYRIGQRDAHITKIKGIIIECNNQFNELNRLITWEFDHEVAESVVFSRQMNYQLNKIWEDYFLKNNPEIDIKTFLGKKFPGITTPIHTELTDRAENIIKTANNDLGYFKNYYPGTYRVFVSTLALLSNVISKHKKISRNNEVIEDLIIKLYEAKDKNNYGTCEDLQHLMVQALVGMLNDDLNEKSQKDIDDLLFVFNMVSSVYLDQDNKILDGYSKIEKGIIFKSERETKDLSEDLMEAEKVLKIILKPDDMLEYRSRIVKIQERNNKTRKN